MASPTRLPPGCGLDLHKPLLYNPYQMGLQTARRLRRCSSCQRIVSPEPGHLRCPLCRTIHRDNTTFPRQYKSLHLRAGRRSGKSLAGAHAVREELAIPDQAWWVCGPTFEILRDATRPTLLNLIPPSWVQSWNEESLELILKNRSRCHFRSLHDPERGHAGVGLHGVWLDEAAFIVARAWETLSPTLAENAGIVISTTSPGGFDWTYREFYKRAIIDKWPGYWAAQYETLDNPLFQQSEVLRREVEEARRTMTPEVFDAEYRGKDVNFQGVIYGQLIDDQTLATDEAVKKFIPEWPNIDASRRVLIGMDSGADHPFGALMVVVTEGGLVAVGEYLQRLQANVTHLGAISVKFGVNRFANVQWSANKNEAQLRLEFALRNVMVVPAENSHQIGIQRVQSWLLAKQLWFVASRVPVCIEQMRTYRYADNYLVDGQKRDKEQVFKKDDEFPDAGRYIVMAWPELPKMAATSLSEREQRRWDAYSPNERLDVERIRDYNKRELEKGLDPDDPGYPIGDMFGHVESMFN